MDSTHPLAGDPHGEIEPSRAPTRRRMPIERRSLTHKFCIDGHEGYLTAGMYDDGTIGELFISDVGKEGSTLRGVFSAWATTLSIALQHGVPLESLVRKFAYMRFEPRGATDNPEIPQAHSIPDYVARWLAGRFLDVGTQDELGVLTPAVKRRRDAGRDTAAPAASAPLRAVPDPGPPCTQCGAGFMVGTGPCLTCSTCGQTTGRG
jgi:ribonucleoside-diphosphate reductase alpha chain